MGNNNGQHERRIEKTVELGTETNVGRKRNEVPNEEENECNWEQKEDRGVDWGKEFKNIEIKDKAECFYDYGWDDEECTLVNEAKEDKATNMDDADLDWEQKADREFDWKIENKNAVQT
ncbi:hypothetical protein ACQ4LE_003342 [Meloidogyne hapla]